MPWPIDYVDRAQNGCVKLDPAHEWPDVDAWPDWYTREDRRFRYVDDGKGELYRRIPQAWHGLTEYTGHFLHYAVSKPGMVAFTASYAHGVADRQTIMKPGRYLAKYYPELSGQQVAHLASLVSALGKPDVVKFARSREEIRNVYLTGPSSCMSHHVRDYATNGIHPVECYAGPDTGIGYMEDVDGRITARTVCIFDDDKPVSYTRIYGDEHRLETALIALGVSRTGSLDRVRLLRFPLDGDAFVCPYLDGDTRYVDDDGEYLVVGGGEYYADRTDGTIGDRGTCCDSCGERVDEDDIRSTGDGYMCDSCYRDVYVYSDAYGEDISRDDAVEVIVRRGRYGYNVTDWIPSHWPDDGRHSFVTCDETDVVIHVDLCVSLVRQGDSPRDSVLVDESAIPSDCHLCGDEDVYFHEDDMVMIDGEWYWENSSTARSQEADDEGELTIAAPIYCGRIEDPRQMELIA